MEYRFDHENLDVYKLGLEVARACATLRIPAGRSHLRDQLQRAADSVVLNLAEGRARGGDAGRNHYRIAAGSAARLHADARPGLVQRAVHPEGCLVLEDDYSSTLLGFFFTAGSRSRTQVDCASASARARRFRGR